MLGLGASTATATSSIGPWNPSRLDSLLMWFRFNHGIVLDAQGDVTKWTNQSGGVHGEQDGTSSASPIQNADGSIEFDSASNSLRFKSGGSNTIVSLGAFSMYFRIKFDASTTISGEDLVEKDANNFFKLGTTTNTRVKISGTRHDWTHDEISEGEMVTVGLQRTSEGAMTSWVDGSQGEPDEGDGTEVITNSLDLIQFGKPTNHSYWYEVVICDDALRDPERLLLMSYLETIYY